MPSNLRARVGKLSVAEMRAQKYWKQMVAIGLLAGLEVNFSNSSLYYVESGVGISVPVKTALQGFNVIFTFLVTAIFDVDHQSRRCFVGCRLWEHGTLGLALVSITLGSGIVAWSRIQWTESRSWIGVSSQLCSSLAFALKYSVMKRLMDNAPVMSSAASFNSLAPTAAQLAFVATPLTAGSALCFLPVFSDTFEMPGLMSILVLGLSVTVVLLCEFRLTRLTSPVTVSVLNVVKNVAVVMFFQVQILDGASSGMVLLQGHERTAFAISSFGCLAYGCARSAADVQMRRNRDWSSSMALDREALTDGVSLTNY